MTILCARQQKRHRYKEQTFGLCGRKQGWDDLREYYWNMYITIGETDDQPSSMHETGHSKLVHWDDPEGWDGGAGGRKVWDRGTYVYLWLIHANVWQKTTTIL